MAASLEVANVQRKTVLQMPACDLLWVTRGNFVISPTGQQKAATGAVLGSLCLHV